MGFLIEFIKHPCKIGAVAPSGAGLAIKMMEPIDFASADVIVEYGPGTGSFTRELISRKSDATALVLIEQNECFYKQMMSDYGHMQNVHIVHGSAEDVVELLNSLGLTHVDYVVSGLPFTSLPKDVSTRIMSGTMQILGKEGFFLTFQYSLVKLRFFKEYFRIVHILHVAKNLPPAYVLIMQKK